MWSTCYESKAGTSKGIFDIATHNGSRLRQVKAPAADTGYFEAQGAVLGPEKGNERRSLRHRVRPRVVCEHCTNFLERKPQYY